MPASSGRRRRPRPCDRCNRRPTPRRQFRESVETLLFLDVIEHIEDDAGFLGTPYGISQLLVRHHYGSAGPRAWSRWDEYYGHFAATRKRASTRRSARRAWHPSARGTSFVPCTSPREPSTGSASGDRPSCILRGTSSCIGLQRPLWSWRTGFSGQSSVPGLSLMCVASVDQQKPFETIQSAEYRPSAGGSSLYIRAACTPVASPAVTCPPSTANVDDGDIVRVDPPPARRMVEMQSRR